MEMYEQAIQAAMDGKEPWEAYNIGDRTRPKGHDMAVVLKALQTVKDNDFWHTIKTLEEENKQKRS